MTIPIVYSTDELPPDYWGYFVYRDRDQYLWFAKSIFSRSHPGQRFCQLIHKLNLPAPAPTPTEDTPNA